MILPIKRCRLAQKTMLQAHINAMQIEVDEEADDNVDHQDDQFDFACE
jgi:hypothetical protein